MIVDTSKRSLPRGGVALLFSCLGGLYGCSEPPPPPKARASARASARKPAAKTSSAPSAAPRTSGSAVAQDGKPPNIVFILADDQRLDAAACMPKLRELIGARGVTFSQNFAGTPLCCPSRATILTGLYAHNHGVITNGDIEEEGEADEEAMPGAVAFRKLGNDERVFTRSLQARGYATAYYGKYLNGYGKVLKDDPGYAPPYWDEWHAFVEPEFYDFQMLDRSGTGKARRTCYLTNRRPLPRAQNLEKKCRAGADAVVDDGEEHYSTDHIAEQAIAFVRASAQAGKPFFIHFAVKAPHGPYQSPARYQPDLAEAKFTDEAKRRLGTCPLFDWKDRPASYLEADMSDKPEWVESLSGKLAQEKAEHVRRKQLMSVLATEDALVRLVDTLKELGIEGNTVLVYNGDNGYAWGERHYIGKNCAYDECAKVPLVVYDPRHPAGGKTLDVFTMNIDLAPTFLELGGAAPGGDKKLDGKSMAKLFAGDASGWQRDYLLTECWGKATPQHPDVHAAVRSKAWKYVEHYVDDARTKVRKRKDGALEIELYDLARDPNELDNLALMPASKLDELGTSAGDVKDREGELAAILHALEKE